MENAIMPLAVIAIALTLFAAWVNHVLWFFIEVKNGNENLGHLILGLAGFSIPFIGVIHGILLWIGKGAKK